MKIMIENEIYCYINCSGILMKKVITIKETGNFPERSAFLFRERKEKSIFARVVIRY